MINKEYITKIFNNIILKEYTLKCPGFKEFMRKFHPMNFITPYEYDGYDGVDWANSWIGDQMGEQSRNTTFTDDEIQAVEGYTETDYGWINGALWDDSVDDLTDDERKQISLIDSAIEKAPWLYENMVGYRYGEMDDTLEEGDIGEWKGFTSVGAYDDEALEYFQGENRKHIKVYLPMTTKLMVIGEDFSKYAQEQELLLARNTKFVVLSKNDYEVEVLVLPPVYKRFFEEASDERTISYNPKVTPNTPASMNM